MIEPGLHEVDSETYHQGDGWRDIIGHSGIVRLMRSPLHYKYGQDEDDEEREDHFDFGEAYHLAILQYDLFKKTVVAPPPEVLSKSGSRAGNAWKEWEAAQLQGGKVILTHKAFNALENMAEVMERCETASAILKNPGFCERSAVWKDPVYEFLGKCRPDKDIPNLGVLVDLKTCRNASQQEFAKACGNLGYDIEAAWYLDGMRALTGIDYQTFIFLAQEKTPPYAVAVYQADEEFIGVGRRKCDVAREIYNNCLAKNYWPGYPDRVQKVYLPVWATKGAAGLQGI